jgi:hypothetical protein
MVITNIPKDEAQKVSTAMSSSKRVCHIRMTHHTGIDVAVALSYAEPSIGVENRETNA